MLLARDVSWDGSVLLSAAASRASRERASRSGARCSSASFSQRTCAVCSSCTWCDNGKNQQGGHDVGESDGIPASKGYFDSVIICVKRYQGAFPCSNVPRNLGQKVPWFLTTQTTESKGSCIF